MAKSSALRTPQIVTFNYEVCLLSRLGTSEAIPHDEKPKFVSDFPERTVLW